MPKPYSTDLRERAVEAVEGGASRREVAEVFEVSVSSVIRWCRRWSETGSVEAKPSGGSTSPLEEHSDWLLTLIAKQPDLTLKEILAFTILREGFRALTYVKSIRLWHRIALYPLEL